MKYLLVIALVLGILVIAGCGTGAASTATSTAAQATVTTASPATAPAPTISTTLPTTTAVSSPTTSPSIPAGWKVFEGDSVSLALPASYEGGKPTDADVAALVEKAIAFNPNLSAYASMIDSGNVPLIMFGEPDENGGMPLVIVMREPTPSGISLEKYVESLASGLDTVGIYTDIKTESMSKDKARLRISASLGGMQFTQYYVLHKVGSNVFGVIYNSGLSPEDTDPVFRTSADTIVIKE